MKKLLLGTVGLAGLTMAAPAFAADLPARAPAAYSKAPAMVAPVYDWSGFYAGINGGGGWSHNCWDINNVVGTAVVTAVPEGCHHASGGMAGAQLGYRWQSANLVFGVEAQGDWASLTGSSLSSPAALTSIITNQTKVDAIGLFTGQIGYAWNNVLWYVKGGAAVTDDTYSGMLTGFGLTVDSTSGTRWGGVVGTGLEFGFAPLWSVGLEYDHLFMGSRNVNFTVFTVPTRIDSIRQDVDMATIRVNYHFGAPLVAKY